MSLMKPVHEAEVRQHPPEVSVVVAARNEAKHLHEALESILRQDGVSFEVVFVDDHSTDDTLAIATALMPAYSHLKVVRNPGRGKCAAFNYGVAQATGRFVCIFAGDDIMPAGSLALRWSQVRNLSDVAPAVGLSKLKTFSSIAKFDGHVVPRAPGKGALSGVSPLMNRPAVSMIFPVPESLPNEDTWMELAILHFHGWTIVHSDVICCCWRVHAGNSINMSLPFQEYNKKLTSRMAALRLFYVKYKDMLTMENKLLLEAKVQCEERRAGGSVIGVIRSRVALIDKLRALSVTNSFMYGVRSRLYGLLSGW
ncbi:glycosyltransferase family 2 protein [Ramlibacter sp. AN1015]|uniref:glycosyltransferase family 2 protein n=1 Tax=Ramlibacter sp. AN1015 TaxID=3133428 RepID=UPI0030C29A56